MTRWGGRVNCLVLSNNSYCEAKCIDRKKIMHYAYKKLSEHGAW